MKLFTSLIVAATVAQAHYTFPRLVVNGKAEEKDWWATRKTRNADTKQGLSSPTSGDIRCYSSQTAANVMEVPAGATIHWVTSQQLNHPGPTQYYLAKAPEGSSVTKWDGSGTVWFKFRTTTATVDAAKQMSWPNQNQYTTVNATIPKSTPSGEYLLRVEQMALHMPNQPQIYLACSQIKITGGGSGNPGPLVTLPGAYKANDPAIFLNLASVGSGAYVGPGPAVWSG